MTSYGYQVVSKHSVEVDTVLDERSVPSQELFCQWQRNTVSTCLLSTFQNTKTSHELERHDIHWQDAKTILNACLINANLVKSECWQATPTSSLKFYENTQRSWIHCHVTNALATEQEQVTFRRRLSSLPTKYCCMNSRNCQVELCHLSKPHAACFHRRQALIGSIRL